MNVPYFNKDRIAEVLDLDKLIDAMEQALIAFSSGKVIQPVRMRVVDEKAGGDVNILLDLAGPLESLERYDELCELLEQCIAMAPALGEDKKFMKYYKKYAKKAAKLASR